MKVTGSDTIESLSPCPRCSAGRAVIIETGWMDGWDIDLRRALTFLFLPCRRRSEVLHQLLSSLQDGPFCQSALVTGGRKLLGRYNNLCSSAEQPSSLSRDVGSAPGPSELGESRTGAVGVDVETPTAPTFGVQSLQEQELHSDKVREKNYVLKLLLQIFILIALYL